MTNEERINQMEKELASLKEEVLNEKVEVFLKEQEWQPTGGAFYIDGQYGVVDVSPSTCESRAFGMERYNKDLAEKAINAMRIHNRALAYVHEHAPDWDGSDPWGVWKKTNGWAAGPENSPSIGSVVGPVHVMHQLADDLNTGRVKL